MIIEHDSRNLFYRNPFGAVSCLSKVNLRLFADVGEIPSAVNLVYQYMDSKPVTIPMYYVHAISQGSIYETKIEVPEAPGLLWYYFVIETNNQTFYYGNNIERLGGLGKIYQNIPPCYQITVYQTEYKTPDWFKQAILYQIFPDRFAKGSMNSFEVGRRDIIRRDWEDLPYYKPEQFGGKYLSNDFFGGNLTGIMEKLPYLHQLGITALYLNPIFKAYSNHKYDIGDYDIVDPMFGSNDLFEELCREASKYGIRIILDGVFSHTGSNSKYFNKDNTYPSLGAYQSKNSPYYNWYHFRNHPDDYECWWDIKTLPHTNESEPSFVEYILTSPQAIVKKWLTLGASGWRLDVADELPSEFIKTMRREIKSVDHESVLIGEVWEDASNKMSYGKQREYLFGEELDSVMNYPLRNALVDFACSLCSAHTFGMRIMSLYENYPRESFYSLMNFLSTHDVERIITILGAPAPASVLAPPTNQPTRDDKAEFVMNDSQLTLAKERLKNIVLLLMTLPGVPCIYYGDEVGMQGYDDPFNRKGFPWGKEDFQIHSIYQRMIAFRLKYSILVDGDFEIIYMFQSCFAFARYDTQKLILISVNMDTRKEVFTRLDLARFQPSQAYDIHTQANMPITRGIITFILSPLSSRVISVDRSLY